MEKIVTLNELNEIIKALDLYSRIDIGQYDEIVKVNCWFLVSYIKIVQRNYSKDKIINYLKNN